MIECHQVANFALLSVIIPVQFADDDLEGQEVKEIEEKEKPKDQPD